LIQAQVQQYLRLLFSLRGCRVIYHDAAAFAIVSIDLKTAPFLNTN